MSEVHAIAAALHLRFPFAEDAVKVQRDTRLWVEVERERFPDVFDHLVKDLRFTILCTITGLDMGADLGFIYHLARESGIMVNLKTRCPKGQSFPSVTPSFPGSSIYEAELEDLLGAKIDGLPPGARYPLPEDWPVGDHPLLKDWKPRTTASTEKGAPGNE